MTGENWSGIMGDAMVQVNCIKVGNPRVNLAAPTTLLAAPAYVEAMQTASRQT
jgi:hypothetical protein